MGRRIPIADRIRAAFDESGEYRMTFASLAYKVFPPKERPQSWRNATHGGPPGCYIALSAAIRRMRLSDRWDRGMRYVSRPERLKPPTPASRPTETPEPK